MKRLILVAMILSCASVAFGQAGVVVTQGGVGGFVSIPGVVSTEDHRVKLGVFVYIGLSNTKNGGWDFTYTQNPGIIDIPQYECGIPEFNVFKYLRFQVNATEPIEDLNHVEVFAEIDGDLCCRQPIKDCCGEGFVDLSGLETGKPYTVKLGLINDIGKTYLKFLFVSIGIDRVTQRDSTAFGIRIFEPDPYINCFAPMALRTGAPSSFNQLSEYEKQTVMASFIESHMPGWKSNKAYMSGPEYVERGAMKAKGVGLPLDPAPAPTSTTQRISSAVSGPGTYTVQLVRGGQPYSGSVILYAKDRGDIRKFEVDGPTISMQNASGTAYLSTDPSRGWVSFNTSSGGTVDVPVY